MDFEQKQLFLNKQPLFKDLTSSQLRMLAYSVKEAKFEPGENIIEQDTQSDGAYFIVSGMVKVYRINENGEEINLALLGEGEIIGELSIIDQEPRSASVTPIKSTQVLVLTQKEFFRILTAHPDMTITLLKTLAKRVRNTSKHLEELLSKNLYERTWATLQTLASFDSNKQIELSQEELAVIIGATRSRVTEVLHQLQSDGKLVIAHRRIQLS